MSVREHREQAERSLLVAVLTVSDTRTLETDLGGNLIQSLLEQAGHTISDRRIVKDETLLIRGVAQELLSAASVVALLVTGGTGLAARDQTTEAIEALYDATIPGYGELFRMLSYQDIGAASMLSLRQWRSAWQAGRLDHARLACWCTIGDGETDYP